MSRRRTIPAGQGLLPLMEARPWRDGVTITYRYHLPGGKPINLGTDYEAAILAVLRLLRKAPDSGTVAELWRLYEESSDWRALRPATQIDYRQCSVELLKVFGTVSPAAITALHVRQYLRSERAAAPVRANREVALLSNLLNLGIDRGDVETNVCRFVKRNRERPRRYAPVPADVARFLAWAWARGGSAAVLAGMAEFIALSGNRRIEFRELVWSHVDEHELRLRRAKQRYDDAPVIEVIERSPAMDDLLRRMQTISGGRPLGPVFPAARGKTPKPYSERAFKSAWARLMTEALDRKVGPPVLLERFAFHDLRAAFVTEHKRQRGELPDLHKDRGTTARVYDRTREVRRKAL